MSDPESPIRAEQPPATRRVSKSREKAGRDRISTTPSLALSVRRRDDAWHEPGYVSSKMTQRQRFCERVRFKRGHWFANLESRQAERSSRRSPSLLSPPSRPRGE